MTNKTTEVGSALAANSLKSMTAFARAQGNNNWGSYAWELRSVNHRYLETQFKLPEKLRQLETPLREALRAKLARGKVECHLHFKVKEQEQAVVLNHHQVEQLKSLEQQLLVNDADIDRLSANQILQWPGVLQTSELDSDQLADDLLPGFDAVLEQLVEARAAEGVRLAALIIERLDQIDSIVVDVERRMPEVLAEHKAKIETKIADFNIELDADRLAQEVVILAQKVDVAEELDRLKGHVTEVRETIEKSEPCGRRLDFLMQELNREANTLGSKSIAMDTSKNSVNLKVLIEQMREQVQNIE